MREQLVTGSERQQVPQVGTEFYNILLSSIQLYLNKHDPKRVREAGIYTLKKPYPNINEVIPVSMQSPDLQLLNNWYWELTEYTADTLEQTTLDADQIIDLIQVSESGTIQEKQTAAKFLSDQYANNNEPCETLQTDLSIIDLHDLMRSFDYLANLPNPDRISKNDYFMLSREDQLTLRSLANGFSYLYMLRSRAIETKQQGAEVPIQLLEKMIAVSAAQTRNFLTYLSQTPASKNTTVLHISEEIAGIFDVIEHKEVSMDLIDLGAFFVDLKPYFEEIIHRRYGYKINVQVEDQRQDTTRLVKMHRPFLMTAIRNLIADATVHGTYPPEGIHIGVTLSDEDVSGYTSINITNPIQIEEEKIQQLCHGLGDKRIVLTDTGEVVEISNTDMETFELHGNGKRSVARTWEQALLRLDSPPSVISYFKEQHWQYNPVTVEPDEGSEKPWFNLTCKFPLRNNSQIAA